METDKTNKQIHIHTERRTKKERVKSLLNTLPDVYLLKIHFSIFQVTFVFFFLLIFFDNSYIYIYIYIYIYRERERERERL